jgi:hypothetical protein
MALMTRQWKLYEFLKANDDKWLTQHEIALGLKELYGAFGGEAIAFHDSDIRLRITEDIRALNNSDIIQKIILSSPKGIKIANEEEYREWSLSKWKSIKGMIRRLVGKDQKAKLNGQVKLVFGESVARDFYETFKQENLTKVKTYEMTKEYTFIRTNNNYDSFRLTLREVIDYLVEVGQYRDDMTEEEIVSLFNDLFDAGAFI